MSEASFCGETEEYNRTLCRCRESYPGEFPLETNWTEEPFERSPPGLFSGGSINFITTYKHDYERIDPNLHVPRTKPCKSDGGIKFEGGEFYGESTQRMDYNFHPSTFVGVRAQYPVKISDHNVVLPRGEKGQQRTGRTLYMDEFPKKRAEIGVQKKPYNLHLGVSTDRVWKSETREKFVPQIYCRPALEYRKSEDKPVFPIISQTKVSLDKIGTSQYSEEYTKWDYQKPLNYSFKNKGFYKKPTVPFATTSTYMMDYPSLLPKRPDPLVTVCTYKTNVIPKDDVQKRHGKAEVSPCGPVWDKVCDRVREYDEQTAKSFANFTQPDSTDEMPVQKDICENYVDGKLTNVKPLVHQSYITDKSQYASESQWQLASPLSPRCVE